MKADSVIAFLTFGAIGVGFGLAYLAYRMLRAEQELPNPRKAMLRWIGVFMIYSMALALSGFFAEYWAKRLPAPEDDTVYISEPYTTEGDTRTTKTLSCPDKKHVVLNTAKCMNTAARPASVRELVAPDTIRCEWNPPQAVGVGLWIEMACKSPPRTR